MRKAVIVILAGASLIALAFGLGVCASFIKGPPFAGGRIGVVRIEGTILTADKTLEQLNEARLDTSIRGVLLRIDSPGGAVSASQEIYEEVKRLSAIKPVYVSMGDVAASGGYYIACGANRIFANPGTITGSIGVRMEHVNLKDLLTWAKIEHQTLKSGVMKDVGSPDRPLSREDREFLEGILREMHAQFKRTVAEARNLKPEEVDVIADGRIYTGEKALEIGLIDQIGGMPVAIRSLAEATGIKGEPKLIQFVEKGPWWIGLFMDKVMSFLNDSGRQLAVYKM